MYLTKDSSEEHRSCVEPAAAESAGAPDDETELTPEMVKAAVNAFFDNW